MPSETPAAPPVPAPPAPVELAPDAGLRLALEVRGWDFAAAPGRIVALAEDFKQLAAFDADTGKPQWRVQVQQEPNGRHTLHLRGDQVILHAGPTRIHVDLRDGRVLGSFPAFFNGSDLQCALRVYEGDTLADWGVWPAPARAGSACAEACDCSLRLFDCGTGAAVGAAFHASETHLYHTMGEPHDTVCFNKPALLMRAAAATIVRAEDEHDTPAIFGLDPKTGKILWQRTDLAAAVSQYLAAVGTDPDGRLCWLTDGAHAFVIDCAAGTTRWRATLAEPETSAQTFMHWHAGALALTHRGERRTTIELRDAQGGKRRWQRSLPADRLPLLPGQPPPPYVRAEIRAYLVLDPATGATVGEIVVTDKQSLLAAPEGGYLRIGGGRLAEFDARGALLRERPLARDQVVGVTRTHLVESTADELRVLRRDTLQPVLTLAGSWSLSPSQPALGSESLFLHEHRKNGMHRALLLRPAP